MADYNSQPPPEDDLSHEKLIEQNQFLTEHNNLLLDKVKELKEQIQEQEIEDGQEFRDLGNKIEADLEMLDKTTGLSDDKVNDFSGSDSTFVGAEGMLAQASASGTQINENLLPSNQEPPTMPSADISTSYNV